MLAVNNNVHFKSSGLRAYQEYYNHHLAGVLPALDFSRAPDVATGVYRVLERMLSGPPTYENLHRLYVKPVKSPYVNKLLYNSQILEIREDYHRISVIDKVSTLTCPSAVIQTEKFSPRSVSGQEDTRFSPCKPRQPPRLTLAGNISSSATGNSSLVGPRVSWPRTSTWCCRCRT